MIAALPAAVRAVGRTVAPNGKDAVGNDTQAGVKLGFVRLPLFLERNLDFSIFLSIFNVFRRSDPSGGTTAKILIYIFNER
jgi:hypothetical protein